MPKIDLSALQKEARRLGPIPVFTMPTAYTELVETINAIFDDIPGLDTRVNEFFLSAFRAKLEDVTAASFYINVGVRFGTAFVYLEFMQSDIKIDFATDGQRIIALLQQEHG